MRRLLAAILVVCCCALVMGAACAAAPYRVLLVDGTKTLEATLRVGGLAGAIRQSGLAEVSVLFTDATSAFADPLAGRLVSATPFDLVIIIPRGIGDGTDDIVWLLAAGSLASSADTPSALALLKSGMALAFGGTVRALGPLDDLWATLTSAYYVAEGWLR
jgi:hypothetical protein